MIARPDHLGLLDQRPQTCTSDGAASPHPIYLDVRPDQAALATAAERVSGLHRVAPIARAAGSR